MFSKRKKKKRKKAFTLQAIERLNRKEKLKLQSSLKAFYMAAFKT